MSAAALLENDRVRGIAVCPCCSSELEIHCPKGHDVDRPKVKPLRAPNRPARLQPKICQRCRRQFQPTGPRSLYCSDRDSCNKAIRSGLSRQRAS